MHVRYTKLALTHLQELKRTSTLQFGDTVAQTTLSKIAEAIQDLRHFPERGRTGRVSGTRELIITGTPFIAAYAIERGDIAILAVLHGARKWPSSLS